MVRKQTWIALVVLLALLSVTFYLQKNPLPSANQGTPTVAPTAATLLLEGWQAQDIVSIDFKNNLGLAAMIAQDSQGSWQTGPEGKTAVDAGKVEEIRSQLASAQVQTLLDPTYSLEAIGLNAPTDVLTIKNKQGQQREIRIGKQTPTGSGYYVQVDDKAPVVVSTGAVEGFLNPIKNDILATPTPEVTPTTAAGSTPTAAP